MKSINSQRRLWLRLLGAVGTVALVASMLMVVDAAAAPSGSSASLEQCTNGATGTTIQLQQCAGSSLAAIGTYKNWVNGNANGSKAHWREGEFISYRVRLSGLATGIAHTLVFDYQTVHSGKHALDYVGSFDATETTSPTPSTFHANNNSPCADLVAAGQMDTAQCTSPASSLPVDSATLTNCGGSAGGPISQAPGSFKLFGPAGSVLDSMEYVNQNVLSGTGQCNTTVKLTFHVGSAIDANHTMVIAWGGHIASQGDWGVNNSASFISGSPFHMALDSLDGASTGSQDRALATSAIFFTPTIATQLKKADNTNATSVNVGAAIHDTSTLSGASNNAGGTVSYTVYSDNACSTPANVGTGAVLGNAGTKTVSGATVPDSNAVSFNTAGTYYWQASYSGDGINQPTKSPCTSEVLTVGKAGPAIATQVKDAANSNVTASIPFGSTVHDTASFTTNPATGGGTSTVSYYYAGPLTAAQDTNLVCNTTGTAIGSAVTVTGTSIPDSVGVQLNAAGTYEFWAIYSGNDNNTGATSTCRSETVVVDKAGPAIATQVKDAANSNVTASIPFGSTVHDTASFTTNPATGGGTSTVSYYYAGPLTAAQDTNLVCNTTGTAIGSAVTVTGTSIPDSVGVQLNAAGTYEFWAIYSGNDNNTGATSTCRSETVVVDKAGPAIATQVKDAANSNVTASIPFGSTVHDTASFTTNPATGGGTSTVSYYYAGPLTAAQDTNLVCNTTGTAIGSAVTVTGTSIPDSVGVQLNAAGTYEFWAIYSGNDNNTGATSTCRSETVVVDKAGPAIATQVKDAANSNVTASIPFGSTVHDTASFTTNPATGGGTSTVSYYYAGPLTAAQDTNLVCNTTGTAIGSAVTVTGTSIPDSVGVQLNAAGTYEFWAIYSGNDNNTGATSTCRSETVVVDKKAPGATTAQTLLPNDAATLTGATSNAGGTLTFSLFDPTDGTCAGTAALSQTVSVNGNDTYNTTNTSFLASAPGTWRWVVQYSGDPNNAGFSIACGTEQFTIDNNHVNPGSPLPI